MSNTGYQSNDLDKDVTILQPLIDSLYKQATLYCGALQVNLNKYNLILDNIWCNVNKQYDYNHMHLHPYSFLSGVYYTKVPNNSGGINFVHSNDLMQYDWPKYMFDTPNWYNALSYYLEPQTGDTLIFPSWLKHEVTHNTSTEDRISYAFNFRLLENDSENL